MDCHFSGMNNSFLIKELTRKFHLTVIHLYPIVHARTSTNLSFRLLIFHVFKQNRNNKQKMYSFSVSASLQGENRLSHLLKTEPVIVNHITCSTKEASTRKRTWNQRIWNVPQDLVRVLMFRLKRHTSPATCILHKMYITKAWQTLLLAPISINWTAQRTNADLVPTTINKTGIILASKHKSTMQQVDGS